jgi:hypothetical protein
MLSRTLVKTDRLEIDGQTYTVDYFEATTDRGTQRYASEAMLGPGDRIIVDDSSLEALEWRVARLMPATLYSRMLARAAA